MAVTVDHARAEAKSRLVLIVLTTLSLRLMDQWRQSIGAVMEGEPDYEMTMIVGAIYSIAAEKLMRTELEPGLQTLENELPYERLSLCNVSSIALATGLNRETVRRKVNKLIGAGVLIKENDSIRIAHGLLQLPLARETVQLQLKSLRQAVNQLESLGAFCHSRK